MGRFTNRCWARTGTPARLRTAWCSCPVHDVLVHDIAFFVKSPGNITLPSRQTGAGRARGQGRAPPPGLPRGAAGAGCGPPGAHTKVLPAAPAPGARAKQVRVGGDSDERNSSVLYDLARSSSVTDPLWLRLARSPHRSKDWRRGCPGGRETGVVYGSTWHAC